MIRQVIQCGDNEIMYFLNNGWEIIGQSPNPFPQPYIIWFVAKDVLPKDKFTKEKVAEEISNARNYE